MSFSEQEKLALTFSYMAYLGFAETGTDRENATAIKQKIDHAISSWPLLEQDWDVIWGPAVFALPATVFDDALLFLVRKKSDPNQYYLAIRGTNPISIPNWVLWDFQAKEQKAWPFVKINDDATNQPEPKVSESTYFGFNTIFSLRPPVGLPGAQQTLIEFLNQELHDKPDAKVCITGHSLGGALAPTVCLWLTEVQAQHAFKTAEFSVVSFAGPTAGNLDFAEHSNATMQGKCHRIANSLDVVPHAWEQKTIDNLPWIYADLSLPFILPTPPVFLFLKHLAKKAKNKHYKQIEHATILEGKKYWPTPYLLGVKYPFALIYLGQAIYQHVWAYPQLMGMEEDIPIDEIFIDSVISEIISNLLKDR